MQWFLDFHFLFFKKVKKNKNSHSGGINHFGSRTPLPGFFENWKNVHFRPLENPGFGRFGQNWQKKLPFSTFFHFFPLFDQNPAFSVPTKNTPKIHFLKSGHFDHFLDTFWTDPTKMTKHHTKTGFKLPHFPKPPKRGQKEGPKMDPFFGPPVWGYPQNPGFSWF